MARIRSVHPGIWTDEAFMGLSAHARLLMFGLWNEAFDDGAFEWKPLTIKARIFPVDSVDVVELLDELAQANFIARDDDHPKRPGLIRNFQRFQRPKKPNSSGMLSDRWLEYVGAKDASSEPVENQSPISSEKSPQMEDGGCSKEVEGIPPLPPEGGEDEFRTKVWDIAPRHPAGTFQDAKEAYDLLTPAEQSACIQGVKALRDAFDSFQKQTGKAPTPTTLHKWIKKRGWEGYGGSSSGELVVVEAGTADFAAIQRMRGKPVSVGGSGKITVKRTELDAARAAERQLA